MSSVTAADGREGRTAPKQIAIAPSCHACAGGSPAPTGSPVIGLVGAPNSGKSTLFNPLTGAKAQMGNWPGTTVEVSRGAWKAGDVTYDVIDFPGAYSLDAMSPDEELTREMLINRGAEDRPDLVIVAVDATAPARGLYLFSEIAEHPYRLVVVLTKTDVAAAQGVEVDAGAMQEALRVPVVAVDPRRRSGVDQVRVTDADAEEQRTSPLADNIRADFDRTSGGHGVAAVWAFMIFLLAYTPCVATLAVQKREFGLKWTMFGLATQLVGAWLLAVAVFQIARLFL